MDREVAAHFTMNFRISTSKICTATFDAEFFAGRHPRWPETTATHRGQLASLSWEEKWAQVSESRIKGDNGTAVHDLDAVGGKELSALVEQNKSGFCYGMSEEHSDAAPVSRTVHSKTDDGGSDARLSKSSLGDAVKSEPDTSRFLPLEFSWCSEPLVPRKGSKLKRRSSRSEESSGESIYAAKSAELLAELPVLTEKLKWRTEMHNRILRQRNLLREKVESIKDRRTRVLR